MNFDEILRDEKQRERLERAMWKPGTRAEFEAELKRYLAQRDAFVVTREVLSALARGDFAAQRAADQMLGQRWPR